MPYENLAGLSQSQSGQSIGLGSSAAAMADPFAGERANYQKRLRDLIANPGGQDSSPYYKYLMDTQMAKVGASNAAGGFRNSGRGLMALQDRAAGVASQAYFPQVDALTKLAMTGSNPGAAGQLFQEGASRSQDYAQMAAAAQGANKSAGGFTPNGGFQQPRMMEDYSSKSTGLPTGGYFSGGDTQTGSQAQSPWGLASYQQPSSGDFFGGSGTDQSWGGPVSQYDPFAYDPNSDPYASDPNLDPYGSYGSY